ncbi:MAG: hypothetical protein ACOY93_01075 [Bacillota bacterium]
MAEFQDTAAHEREQSSPVPAMGLLWAGTFGSAGLIGLGVMVMLTAPSSTLGPTLTVMGLIAQVAVPVLRVVVDGWEFARRGERPLALLSLAVLIALGLGMAVGAAH